ncbi:hypothetical protein [Salinarimonas chemoclinalis]|uniref:hypothetical protein n=1 Tax=Salinarimonas chemoclinalis TaxID=3241599 RepID=UPI0035571043
MIPATFLYPWLVDAEQPLRQTDIDISRRALRTPWIAHVRSIQYACALVAAVVFLGG